jgi:hypothetical protein
VGDAVGQGYAGARVGLDDDVPGPIGTAMTELGRARDQGLAEGLGIERRGEDREYAAHDVVVIAIVIVIILLLFCFALFCFVLFLLLLLLIICCSLSPDDVPVSPFCSIKELGSSRWTSKAGRVNGPEISM